MGVIGMNVAGRLRRIMLAPDPGPSEEDEYQVSMVQDMADWEHKLIVHPNPQDDAEVQQANADQGEFSQFFFEEFFLNQ